MQAEILAQESLQRRVEELRDERDLYRALLHMDAPALRSVAGEADTVTARLRTLLQQPARSAEAFRTKIAALNFEIELIAASPGGARLPGVARRAAGLQESLHELERRTQLSGDDLLPVIAGVEQLLLQLAVAYEYVTSERHLVPEMPERAPPVTAPVVSVTAEGGTTEAPAAPPPQPEAPRIADALQQLAGQLAKEHHREVHLIMLGLEAVPEAWVTAVFDMLSQLVRNSIEHGIEPRDVRRRRGKSAEGTLLVEFRPRADGGYELKYQDDGSGVDTEGVRDSALRQHAVDPLAAQQASDRQLASLILLPGVTTARNADGRGQGLKIVREQAKRLGGAIKVASKRGRFLRFSVDFHPKE
ncbi:MAG: ATP-binding protein [Steroidobacteraceae bacterium]